MRIGSVIRVVSAALLLPGVDPVRINVDLYGQAAYRELTVQGSQLDAVLATRPGITVSARIYDANGVLLGESTAASPGGNVRVPAGLVPQSRLRVSNLNPGATYLLSLKFGGALGITGNAQLGLASLQATHQ